MPAYFDSSVLLSILKHEPREERASVLWNTHKDRVSSLLFEIECWTVLKRYTTPKFPPAWLLQAQKSLSEFLDTIALKPVDDAIAKIVREQAELSQIRALDSIHVATALFFQKQADEPFYFVTFDSRMANAAQSVGLEVLGSA
ncbi:MAG: type II toxin-antitoxin system VapC family toxin [Deltaproteobacteria bacterium]|nr:type II toxin-antitoxin system VapC family toxin [Deltaproteobacteria bacterium]